MIGGNHRASSPNPAPKPEPPANTKITVSYRVDRNQTDRTHLVVQFRVLDRSGEFHIAVPTRFRKMRWTTARKDEKGKWIKGDEKGIRDYVEAVLFTRLRLELEARRIANFDLVRCEK
jgi:hypothetical protein